MCNGEEWSNVSEFRIQNAANQSCPMFLLRSNCILNCKPYSPARAQMHASQAEPGAVDEADAFDKGLAKVKGLGENIIWLKQS